jgi:hypothetical protein
MGPSILRARGSMPIIRNKTRATGDTQMKPTLLVAGLVAALLAAGPAAARSIEPFSSDVKYYWEVDPPGRGMASYGWDYQPRPWKVNGPVVRKSGESLYSFCARQVGRIIRVDDSGLVRSVALTDSCVRRGGRY